MQSIHETVMSIEVNKLKVESIFSLRHEVCLRAEGRHLGIYFDDEFLNNLFTFRNACMSL
jgi:hypothetical protein